MTPTDTFQAVEIEPGAKVEFELDLNAQTASVDAFIRTVTVAVVVLKAQRRFRARHGRLRAISAPISAAQGI